MATSSEVLDGFPGSTHSAIDEIAIARIVETARPLPESPETRVVRMGSTFFLLLHFWVAGWAGVRRASRVK
jgi:hypothetical protein